MASAMGPWSTPESVGKEFEVVHSLEEAYEIVGVGPMSFGTDFISRGSGGKF